MKLVDPIAADALLSHVGCGSLDDRGQCWKCDEIRRILLHYRDGKK